MEAAIDQGEGGSGPAALSAQASSAHQTSD